MVKIISFFGVASAEVVCSQLSDVMNRCWLRFLTERRAGEAPSITAALPCLAQAQSHRRQSSNRVVMR